MKTISRHLFLLFAVMVWSSLAFGGEIHDAAAKGDLKKVKALLKDHPELVFTKDGCGSTPLHWAAQEGRKDVAALLLAKGADVNAKNDDGWTPLRWALIQKHKDVAKLLIVKGADVNAKCDDGITPLRWAVLDDFKDLARLMLAREARYTIHDVAFIGDLERARALLKDHPELVFRRSIGKDEGSNRTPLHSAADGGNKGVAELLLAKGAEINAKDDYGCTPLHYAAFGRYKDVMELLLAKGADVNAKAAFDGSTALHIVTEELTKQTAEFLVVTLEVRKDLAELLLAKGADVNAKDKYGRTPLYVAMEGGQKAVVELLRQHGGHE